MDAAPSFADPALPPPGGLRGVLDALGQARARGRSGTLAVIVATQGSTYRKRGALAWYGVDMPSVGALSGGCLEPALEARAREVLASGTPGRIELDTRDDDDPVFGSGSGCRGHSVVLLLPLDGSAAGPFVDALTALARGEGVLGLALVRDGPDLGALAGRIGARGFALRADAGLASVLGGLAEGAARRVGVLGRGRSFEVEVLALAPPPRLVVVGAGPEAPALLSIARTLGWRTLVLDHRPALAGHQRLPQADAVQVGRPAALLPALALGTQDALVVMSHGATIDGEALTAAATTAVGRVLLLGPAARRDELLEALTEDARTALVSRLEAPAGLRLGGDGPESIALSIAASLQRGYTAGG